MILAEGRYTAVARNKDKIYQRDFTVVAGKNTDVEVLMKEQQPQDAAATRRTRLTISIPQVTAAGTAARSRRAHRQAEQPFRTPSSRCPQATTAPAWTDAELLARARVQT